MGTILSFLKNALVFLNMVADYLRTKRVEETGRMKQREDDRRTSDTRINEGREVANETRDTLHSGGDAADKLRDKHFRD